MLVSTCNTQMTIIIRAVIWVGEGVAFAQGAEYVGAEFKVRKVEFKVN